MEDRRAAARKRFEQRLEIVTAFAERVEALTPAEWVTLRAHCAPLEGSTPQALLARARLEASAHQLLLPSRVPLNWQLRAIVGAASLVTGNISLAKQLAFSAAPSLDEPSRPLRGSTGNPAADRWISADFLIDRAVRAHAPRLPGIATALHTAAAAIQRRSAHEAAGFRECYRWVEPVIPIASIDDERGLIR